MGLDYWRARVEKLSKVEIPPAVSRILKVIFLITLIAYIGHQLHEIGWQEVLDNLPLNPLFYILFILIYLSTPLWEVVIYRNFWNFDFKKGLKAFIVKKILNAEVVGYSGEVYLYSWAKKHLGLDRRESAGPVKDNAILSSVVSNVTILILLLVFTLTSDVDLFVALNMSRKKLYTILGVILGIVLLVILFRKNVFHIEPDKVWKIAGIHEVRILCTYSLEMLQWAIIMPQIPFQIWFALLAVKLVTSRLPLVPNQDLIFTGLGIELSRALQVSSAGIAGILLTNSVLLKITNFTLYLLFQFYGKEKLPSAESNEKEDV